MASDDDEERTGGCLGLRAEEKLKTRSPRANRQISGGENVTGSKFR